MTVTIGRREVLVALSGAAVVWPLPARAQQPARPVMGYLSIGSPDFDATRLTGLRQGMSETGYVEGRNLAINTAGREIKSIEGRWHSWATLFRPS